jgi:hypothetical protein
VASSIRARRVEHAAPDVAAVHRLVARAAARDDGDLALDGRVVAHDDRRVEHHPDAVAVGRGDAFELVLQHPVGAVDELLHRRGLGVSLGHPVVLSQVGQA